MSPRSTHQGSVDAIEPEQSEEPANQGVMLTKPQGAWWGAGGVVGESDTELVTGCREAV